MMFRSAAVWAALAISVSPALAEEKRAKPAPEDRSAKLSAMIGDFVKARKEGRAAIRSATTDEDRKAAEAQKSVNSPASSVAEATRSRSPSGTRARTRFNKTCFSSMYCWLFVKEKAEEASKSLTLNDLPFP